MRQSLLKDWSESQHRVQCDHVLLIDEWFEISELGEAFEYLSKLVAIDAIIVQEKTIDMPAVKNLTGWGKALDIALAQEIVLQANRLFPDLIQNGKGYVFVLLTLREILEVRVLLISLNKVRVFEL